MATLTRKIFERGSPPTRRRVLLVEDDRATARALKSVIHRLDCAVVTASRLSQAKQRVARQPFDLAVLDIELPDGRGLDFVLHLRQQAVPCAALVLTGSREQRYLEEAVGLGVVEYMLKPVEAEALVAAIQRGMEQTEHMRRWIQRQPQLDEPARGRVPLGLGRSPADLVHRVAIEFDLTEREEDALTLVAEGHRDREISERLEVSYSRVRQLLRRSFNKLGCSSRNDFIRFLVERQMR